MQFIVHTIRRLREKYPRLRYHLQDGNEHDVSEQLNSGLLDFGVFVGQADVSRFDALQFPIREHWGLAAPGSSACAQGQHYARGFHRTAARHVAAGAWTR